MANNKIATVAISMAWPKGTPSKKYTLSRGGKAYGNFAKVLHQVYPYHNHWSRKPSVGASCDVFSGTCVRYSGADKKFPRGLAEQIPHLKKSNKWQKISKSQPLKGGDVQVRYGGHIRIVVEIKNKKYVAEAGFTYGHFGHIGPRAHHSNYTTYRSKILPEVDTDGTTSETTSTTQTTSTTTTTQEETTETKNKDTTIVIVKSEEDVTAIQQTKIQTLLQDFEKVAEYCTIKNIDSIKMLKTMANESLLNEYQYLLQVMQTLLIPYSQFLNPSIYFINNNYGLAQLTNVEKNNFSYFQTNSLISKEKWINIYNNLYLKKCAIEYYIVASKQYKSVLLTSEYLNELYSDMNSLYNNQLSSYQQLMNEYVNKNTETIDVATQLNLINQQISQIENNISNIQTKIKTNYSNVLVLQKKLSQYISIKDNLIITQNNFKTNNFSDKYTYWNKNIIQEPNLLNFWLEFSNSNEMNNYNVQNIGNKIYYEHNDNMNFIYQKNIPQIIYYNDNNIKKNKTGYTYLQINDISLLFKNSNQGISSHTIIDNLLYKYAYCYEEKNLSIVPIYYLEPNRKISIYDSVLKTQNDYIINKINNSLNYNSTMSITVTKIAEKLY